MKIIEGMKKVKDLQVKAEDLRQKIKQYCADLDYETPVYPNQKEQVDQWLQAHSDILHEILGIRTRIQRTNLDTKVTIQLGDNNVTKTIAEWVNRRRDLATLEKMAWESLGIKEGSPSMKEGYVPTSTGEKKEVKIRRYYDPKLRDAKVSLFRSEPLLIDSTLEVINAVTDLVE